MVRHMANNSAALNKAFHALADPTRRSVVKRLVGGPATVTELSAPFAIGLPTFMKHIRVLEESGLISSQKSGRTRTCQLRKTQLLAAEKWLSAQRSLWESRTDRLAGYVEALQSRVPKNEQ